MSCGPWRTIHDGGWKRGLEVLDVLVYVLDILRFSAGVVVLVAAERIIGPFSLHGARFDAGMQHPSALPIAHKGALDRDFALPCAVELKHFITLGFRQTADLIERGSRIGWV